MKPQANALTVRRVWGEVLDLFLLGDALATIFLPFALDAGADTPRLIAACAILFVLTLALRLAAWGIGRLFDRRILGALGPHTLTLGARVIALDAIRTLGYRYAPLARLFGRRPSGLWLKLDDETLTLDHAPYWLRVALGFRCPDALKHKTTGMWLTFGGATLLAVLLTVLARW